MGFAAWMQTTRLSKGMSVSECAKRAGISQPVWTEWEDAPDSKEWRRATVRKIAFALGEPESIAMREADKMADGETGSLHLAQQIDQYLMRLRPEKRPAAERMLVEQARCISEMFAA